MLTSKAQRTEINVLITKLRKLDKKTDYWNTVYEKFPKNPREMTDKEISEVKMFLENLIRSMQDELENKTKQCELINTKPKKASIKKTKPVKSKKEDIITELTMTNKALLKIQSEINEKMIKLKELEYQKELLQILLAKEK